MPVAPGQIISHYRIVRRLGKGGMGEVYLAEDTTLNRRIALKVLPAEVAQDPERRRRFEREAQAVAALNHPNIVVVHSVEEAEGIHFITMEHVEGRTLSELIPKEGLPLGRLFELAAPLADAISAAHERGITHRDLKPENVMVTGEGRLKVLDFGLAKLMEEAPAGEAASQLPTATATEPGRILGTVAYMSPEQAQGKPVDHRSDVFSLGVVLYVMATGRRPFEGDTPASILSSVLKDTPPSLTELKPTLPRHLGRIVRRCLHKDPERRYQTAKDIRNELEELKKELDSGELQVPVAERARRPVVIAAVGLGALVLGISIYAVFFRRETAEDAWEIRPLTTMQGWEGSPTWSPDGSFIAYDKPGPGGEDIYVMASSGGDPLRLTRSPPSNTFPRWSPTGQVIAFVSSRGAETAICLIPALGGPARELVRITDWIGNALGAMPWSPDGTKLLFSRGGALWKIDIGTGEEARLTDPDVGGAAGTWSPNGKWIAFTRRQDERPELWLLPAEGGKPRPLLVDAHGNDAPAWSADGRRIVFQSDRTGASNLWEIEVTSGRLRQLTVGVNVQDPTVARDGRVAFIQTREGADLYISRVADGSRRQITFHRGGSYAPRFAPDGSKLVYESNRSGDEEIWMLDLTTGAERQLTFDPAYDTAPDWSPDGRQVAFFSNRDGGPGLWILNVDGGAPRRLTDRKVSYSAPRWSPDGRAISFYVEKDVFAVDPDGGNPRQLLSGVLRPGHMNEASEFNWYRDSLHAVYTRRAEDGSGEPQMVLRDLESGREVVLFRGIHAETIVSPDGRAVAFSRGSPFQQELCVLRLGPPDSSGGLPEPIGDPQQLTDGKSVWHVHNGGFSPDGKEIVYTHAQPEGEIMVIENYR